MYIELSYTLDELVPVFPGTPHEKIIPITRTESGDAYNTSKVEHCIHTGTHVDVPWHFQQDGKTIDKIPIEDFVYTSPLLIDCPVEKGCLIKKEHLTANIELVTQCDLLMVRTGYWQKRVDPEKYCNDFPGFSKDAAHFLRNELMKCKAVAIDTVSIENPAEGISSDFIVHRTLIDASLFPTKPLLIYEDVNLGVVESGNMRKVYAFPIRFLGLDGAPVSMVAEVEDRGTGR